MYKHIAYHIHLHMATSDQPSDADRARRIADLQAEREEMERAKRLDIEDGVPALKRLIKVAQGSSGQCPRVASFLAGCYNGIRCPVDLTDLRAVDFAVSEDILRVLRMDRWCQRQLHNYIDDGGVIFEAIIARWGLDKRFKRLPEPE
jgi:hypothetical protein